MSLQDNLNVGQIIETSAGRFILGKTKNLVKLSKENTKN